MRRRMKENGDRPCGVDDGTGIGATYPQRQVDNPLPLLDEDSVCLGIGGSQCAPVLGDWLGKRELNLSPTCRWWVAAVVFPLSARKSSWTLRSLALAAVVILLDSCSFLQEFKSFFCFESLV